MAMSVNARLRQIQRIVDCDPRVVHLHETQSALVRVLVDYQRKAAECHFVIEQLRQRHYELGSEITAVSAAIRRKGNSHG